VSFSSLLAMADRAALTAHGDPVTYSPGAGSPVSVCGIFDAAYQRVEAGEPGISSSGPGLFLRLADLPSDPGVDSAATVTVATVVYRAWEVKPDGLGGVLLLLHKV
jgi:hypothetical protein